MNRIDVIQRAIDLIGARTYLEIGVRAGESFIPIVCERKIGVDPEFVNIDRIRREGVSLFEMTSDEYFKKHAERFDVAFIDGLHTHQQSFKDANNCLKWAYDGGLVILHDCNPTDEGMTNGKLPDFTGDVWKTIVSLRTDPFLRVCVIDCDYGVGVVARGMSHSVLNYSPEEIHEMGYSYLEKNRKSLLNLLPPEYLDEWIETR